MVGRVRVAPGELTHFVYEKGTVGELAATQVVAPPVRRAIEVLASPRDTGENDMRALHRSARQGAGVGKAEELGFLFDRGKDGFHGATTGNGQAPDRELLINISCDCGTMT